jgi:hypothetical protein
MGVKSPIAWIIHPINMLPSPYVNAPQALTRPYVDLSSNAANNSESDTGQIPVEMIVTKLFSRKKGQNDRLFWARNDHISINGAIRIIVWLIIMAR